MGRLLLMLVLTGVLATAGVLGLAAGILLTQGDVDALRGFRNVVTPKPVPIASPISTATPAEDVLCRFDRLRQVENALEVAYHGQQLHVGWVEYLDARPDFDTTVSGDADHHLAWVDSYQRVIDLLSMYQADCNALQSL